MGRIWEHGSVVELIFVQQAEDTRFDPQHQKSKPKIKKETEKRKMESRQVKMVKKKKKKLN